jgi:predicted acylesterase/phospholipase RssA
MFETVVFSGGGNLCFWQAGFWQVVSAELSLRPKRVLAVSAGAFVSCGLFAGVMERFCQTAASRYRANERNFDPLRAAKGKRPFPHFEIFRETLLQSFDAAAFERLQASVPIHIQTATPPRFVPLGVSVGLSIAGSYVTSRLSSTAGPRLNRWIGFRPHWFSTHDCRTREEVVDLVCASSCIPPIFPVTRVSGRVAIDGGFADNSPVALHPAQDLGRTLVLLTRRQASLPTHPSRCYCQPRLAVPVKKFDATLPDSIHVALDCGHRDGWDFVRHYRNTADLNAPAPNSARCPLPPPAAPIAALPRS